MTEHRQTTARLIKRHGLWVFVLISLLLHISGTAPEVIKRLWPEAPAQQPLSPEQRAALERQQAAAAQQTMIAQQQATLREQIRQQFDGIADGVDPELTQELWSDVEPDLQASLTELEAMLEQGDYDNQAFNEEYKELSAQMYEQTAEHLKKLLRKELLDAIVQQVDTHTNPKLAADLDKRMQQHQGKREEKRLSDAARRDTERRRRDVKRDVSQLQKEVERLTKDQQALARQAAAQGAQGEQKEQGDHDAGTANKQHALQQQLEKAQQQMHALQQDISKRLPDLASDEALEHSAAQLNDAAAQQQSALDAATQQQSAKAMQQSADALKQAAQSLQQLKQAVSNGPAVDQLAKQALKRLMQDEIKPAIKQQFDKQFTEEVIPNSTSKIVKDAGKYLNDFNMHTDQELMERLEQAVNEKLSEEVPEQMQAAAEDLALQQTTDKHALADVESGEQQLELANESAMRKAIVKKFAGDRQRQVKRHLDQAQRKVELGDMSAAMAALKAKLQMMNQAELLADHLRNGRGDSGEFAEFMTMMEMMGMMSEQQADGGAAAQGMEGFGSGAGNGRGSGGGVAALQRVKAVNDLREQRGRPGAVYSELQRQAEQLVSRSTDFPSRRSALLTEPLQEQAAASDSKTAERHMIEPDFNPIKFGYASMAREPVVLDGALTEWDLERTQYVSMLYSLDGDLTELPKAQSVRLYMMWDHQALYVALIIPNDEATQTPSPNRFWYGDTVEIWLDTLNYRAPLLNYVEASQMWFMPFGTASDPHITAGYNHGYHIGERGHTGKDGRDTRRLTRADQRLSHAHKMLEGNAFQIEIRIPQSTLHGPRFKAGSYLGFKLTCNDVVGRQGIVWSPRFPRGFERPDKWGDVLLLGSDAVISFKKDMQGSEALELFVPGEPVCVQVEDPDMNIDPAFKDQVTVQAFGANGDRQLLVLGETDKDSGVFIGGLNTHSIYTGMRDHDESLAVEPGTALRLQYLDQRRGYGESNEQLEQQLPASWPVLKLGSAH